MTRFSPASRFPTFAAALALLVGVQGCKAPSGRAAADAENAAGGAAASPAREAAAGGARRHEPGACAHHRCGWRGAGAPGRSKVNPESTSGLFGRGVPPAG